MSRLLAVAVFACSVTAFAEKPRISILEFKGSKGAAVRAQLSKSLCKAYACVKPGKSEDIEVAAVVVGEVSKKDVAIKVYFKEDSEPVTRKLSHVSGKLAGAAIQNAAGAVKEAVDQHG